jgi:hypothetical protein
VVLSRWNSGDTILNSQCCHSPLEAGTETPSMNVGDTHDPPLEELRAAHGQENKYGVPPRIARIPWHRENRLQRLPKKKVFCPQKSDPFKPYSGTARPAKSYLTGSRSLRYAQKRNKRCFFSNAAGVCGCRPSGGPSEGIFCGKGPRKEPGSGGNTPELARPRHDSRQDRLYPVSHAWKGPNG